MDDAEVTGGMTRARPSALPLRVVMRGLAATAAITLVLGIAGCAPEPVEQGTAPVMPPRIELADIVAPPTPLDAAAVPGLFPQRVVPSGVPWISARWSQLPGQTPFNQQQQGWVRAETTGFTGRTSAPAFVPRASPAGSGGASRGCALGSSLVPVAALLADPALAPAVPAGTPALLSGSIIWWR